ncbi:MAG TPA: 30S ribosomal protein S4 [Polyangiales bacterium]|nr:30S ribosomal protein S4 [Polyangiales bacterium]
MSRYTGPRVKIMRALGVDLPGLSPKTSERRPYPPGQHGQRRRKETEYGKRLKEKQKIRMNYGLSERQMRKTFQSAVRSKQNTGTKLIELLERRLDNVVFRAGFARSIPAARQLVNHGHILINGRRVDIPSFLVKPGMVLTVRESSQKIDPITLGIALSEQRRWDSSWLNVDAAKFTVTVTGVPDETAIPFPADVQLVIELYAQA